MKVKCLNCGLVYGVEVWWKQSCPQCGEVRYVMKLEDFEKIPNKPEEKIDDLYMATINFVVREWLKKKGYMYSEKMGVPDEPVKHEKEEDLAFEIFEYFNGKKINVRKIYLNGHIEGFRRDPCIVNHIYPKIMALKSLLQQMNKDYRDLIEAYMVRGLPLDNVPLHELYIKEMERIMNIVHTI